MTVVYVWKYNPDSAAEKFELVKTYTAENCQSFSAGGVEPVRPTTTYDEVPEAMNFQALAKKNQLKILELKDATSNMRRDMGSFDSRILSWISLARARKLIAFGTLSYQVCLHCKSNDQTQCRISLGCM